MPRGRRSQPRPTGPAVLMPSAQPRRPVPTGGRWVLRWSCRSSSPRAAPTSPADPIGGGAGNLQPVPALGGRRRGRRDRGARRGGRPRAVRPLRRGPATDGRLHAGAGLVPGGGVLDVGALPAAGALLVCGGLTPAHAAALGPVAGPLRDWLAAGGRTPAPLPPPLLPRTRSRSSRAWRWSRGRSTCTACSGGRCRAWSPRSPGARAAMGSRSRRAPPSTWHRAASSSTARAPRTACTPPGCRPQLARETAPADSQDRSGGSAS
jgi:hypothetical protein